MVDEVRLYIEGGGSHNETKIRLRQGFRQFFNGLVTLARANQVEFRIVMGGSCLEAFKLFRAHIRSRSGAFSVLLVDSEGPIGESLAECLPDPHAWRALELPDQHCHLMVQAMEAWLLADIECLKNYYGQLFEGNSIPPEGSDVESLSTDSLIDILEKATRHTRKGVYHKIRHASELLEKIDATKVRQSSAHCDRLFTVMSDVIEKNR
ncbi:MAG: DUF4276 family protein [Chloroflexota bacterium]